MKLSAMYPWLILSMLAACEATGAPPPDDGSGTGGAVSSPSNVGSAPAEVPNEVQERGGQSGTDGAGGIGGCANVTETEVALDQPTAAGTGTTLQAEFELTLANVRDLPIAPDPMVGASTTLTLEIARWGARAILREAHDPNVPVRSCPPKLSVPVTLRVSTADGLLDDELEGRVDEELFHGATIDGATSSGFLTRLSQRLAQPSSSLTSWELLLVHTPASTTDLHMSGSLTVSFEGLDEAERALALSPLFSFVGVWPRTPPPPPATYSPPAAFAPLCRAAKATRSLEELAFDGIGDGTTARLNRAIAGRWIRCAGTLYPGDSAWPDPVAQAGIEIAPDGSFKHLGERAGALVELPGFGHEGKFTMHVNPYAMGLSDDRSTMKLNEDTLYVATDLPVQPALVPSSSGDQLGAAACGMPETSIAPFASESELRAQLARTWWICSNPPRAGAAAIAFTADGRYTHLDAQRTPIASGTYQISSHQTAGFSIPSLSLSMTDDDGERMSYALMSPTLSARPVKVAAEDYNSERDPSRKLTVWSAWP